MTTVSSVNAAADQTSVAGTTAALGTQDFLKLMITELTNQDPFEPMKNQDLLNQMSTIQELQSNQEMNKSFSNMMGRLDDFLLRQRMSDATGLIGQMVSGTTEAGLNTYGKVVGVNLNGSTILLELDNGGAVDLGHVTSLGGVGTEDLVGNLIMGTASDGSYRVGTVASVEITDSGTMLLLESGERVPLANAVTLNAENTAALIGLGVIGQQGGEQISGTVSSIKFTADDTVLMLDNGQQLSLRHLTTVISPNA